MKIKALFIALLMLAATPVPAAGRPGMVVEGVQMPAWVEHANGARDPLAIGMALTNKDRIFTGPESRALLRLPMAARSFSAKTVRLVPDDLGQKKIQLRDRETVSQFF